MIINRRVLFVGTLSSLLFAQVSLARAAEIMSAAEVYEKAASGKVILVDIRTPEEWAETGTGVGAKRLDMRRDDFEVTLANVLGGDKSTPVALICARGVRSHRLAQVLSDSGYANIIDVPEGMLGSYAGPGWLERGLPVVH